MKNQQHKSAWSKMRYVIFKSPAKAYGKGKRKSQFFITRAELNCLRFPDALGCRALLFCTLTWQQGHLHSPAKLRIRTWSFSRYKREDFLYLKMHPQKFPGRVSLATGGVLWTLFIKKDQCLFYLSISAPPKKENTTLNKG